MPKSATKTQSDCQPIAVIGMACRLPGDANSLGQFWDLLSGEIDAITEVPHDRWNIDGYYHPDAKTPGHMYTRWGGFLSEYKRFDADFFGISPREAEQIDPQQRLLLELSWEAIEFAGIPVDALAGSDTAVYVGISSHEYGFGAFNEPNSLTAYSATGGSLSIAANRISYAFDLHGPSLSIDTACSSSLVALNDACTALGRGDSRIAIVGGVNALMSPHSTVAFCRASMLSPTGRCRAFSAEADGYVRSEGGGVVVLKRLDHAKADGDPIQAVILGAGVNQDGRTAGLAMPSAEGQEALLRRVYTDAGVDPADVAYVEAHGTGTPVGDPIECAAIGNALGRAPGRSDPCIIGSVKTNVGHLESASGIVGLLKAILSLQNREIPASLHSADVHPDIPFDELNLSVATKAVPLSADRWPHIFGVNSFGFGGTNAHVIVSGHGDAQNTEAHATVSGADADTLLLLSARSQSALTEVAGQYADYLRRSGGPPLSSVAHAAARRRSHHSHRLAVVGRSGPEIADILTGFAEDSIGPNCTTGRASKSGGRVCFLFSGNGSQWGGMGQDLLTHDAIFAAAVDEIDALFEPLAGWSLRAEFERDPDLARIDHTEIAQPLLFAFQIGLCRSLSAQGLSPDVVIGHSVGEVAAAYAAGKLSLEAATRVIFVRSRSQQTTHGAGKMAAVGLPADDAYNLANASRGGLTVAGVNSPASVTLSGDEEALVELGRRFEADGTFFRILPLAYAFHSRFMDPIEADVLRDLDGLPTDVGAMPMISTVTGDFVDGRALDAQYWWQNVRQAVQFRGAMEQALAEGTELFVEVGPHPVLEGYVRECLRAADVDGSAVATVRRTEPETPAVLLALGKAYAHGAQLDFGRLYPGPNPPISLPAYPWQRELFDLPSADPTVRDPVHPLLGTRVGVGEPVWTNRLWAEKPSWIQDHVVAEATMLPGAAFIEAAVAAAAQSYGIGALELENFELRKALVFTEGDPQQIEVHLSIEDGVVQVSSGDANLASQNVHCKGRVALGTERAQAPPIDLQDLKDALGEPIGTEAIYARFEDLGLKYGRVFRPIADLWPGQGEALARLDPPAEIRDQAGRYHLHPTLLDGCLQTVVGATAGSTPGTTPYVPTHIERLRLEQRVSDVRWCHARVRSVTPRSLLVDYALFDNNGIPVGRIERVRLVRLDQVPNRMGAYTWRAVPRPNAEVALYSPLHAVDLREILATTERRIPAPVYYEVFKKLDELSVAYAANAFVQLGLGEASLDPTEAPSRAGVAPAQLNHFEALWAMLVEAGVLTNNGAGWNLSIPLELADPTSIWRELLLDHPGYATELQLVGRAGDLTADLLRGDTEPLEIIFPGGDPDLLESFYGASLSSTYVNGLAAGILESIAADWPKDRPLRVLEIGAGTGALTRALLPLLPEDRTQYLFTDVSESLLTRAEARFSAYRFVQFSIFDIERPLDEQDFAAESFDLIVGANVVHATANLSVSLKNLHDALQPSGVLLLVEVCPSDMLTLIFGGLKGWRLFTDERSTPTSPLHNDSDWLRALEAAGFHDATSITDATDGTRKSTSVTLSRRPALDTPAVANPILDADRNWLVFANIGQGSKRQAALAKAIKTAVEQAGGYCAIISDEAAHQSNSAAQSSIKTVVPEGYADAISGVAELGHKLTDIVHLWSIPDELPAETGMLPNGQDARAVSAVMLSQALPSSSDDPALRIWFATAGAQAVRDGDVVDPWQAPVWGVARTLMTERDDLQVRLLDFGLDDDDAPRTSNLLRELTALSQENEVIYRGESRYVLRLVPASASASAANSAETAKALAFKLDSQRKGTLDGFNLTMADVPSPQSGEIVAEVRAAGLNFRDVLMKLGVLPDEAFERGFAGPTMGLEFAGRVVEVSDGVSDYSIGDNVFGFARGALASHVAVPANVLLPMPEGFDFSEAATLPTVAVTVIYALGHLAQLAPGERVLIHGAAGGVGLAAIQYSQHIGAEIFATVGTPEKRAIVERLGIRHIFDSRSLSFRDDVLEATDHEGVDVVLNSLAGPAIQKGISILRPYGRFIELGKRDFFADSRIGLRPFRHNVSFFGVDVDQILIDRPKLGLRLFEEFSELLTAGTLRPLPHRIFPLTDATEAFRHMQQSRHVGKVILDTTRCGKPVQAGRTQELELRPDATYLVVGGLGGFGLATAGWLVDKGARNLVLVGRSGSARTEAAGAVEELRARGVDVRVMAADITDIAQVERTMRIIDAEMPPLRGVIHAAMVIDDALSLNLTSDRIKSVLAPKTIGAWNLHVLTRERELDFFVLYSSAAAVVGTEGQSSYAGANVYLDALARYRNALGLPALAVAWGAIGDVGYLADRGSVQKALADRFGIAPMSAARALKGLESALQDPHPYLVLAEMNWGRMFRASSHLASFPRFAELKAEAELAGLEEDETGFEDVRTLIAHLPRPEAVALVQQRLARQIGQVLRIPPAKLDPERSLLELGMDSLMFVEMQMAVEENLGLSLSATEMIDKPTISALAGRLTDMLLGSDSGRNVRAEDGKPNGEPGKEPAEPSLGQNDPDDMNDESLYDIVEKLADLTQGTRHEGAAKDS